MATRFPSTLPLLAVWSGVLVNRICFSLLTRGLRSHPEPFQVDIAPRSAGAVNVVKERISHIQ